MLRFASRPSILAGSAVLLAVTAAVAGNGVGGVFNLGQTNTVDATTQLSGSTGAPQLNVINSSRQNGSAGVRASASRAGVNYGVHATTGSPTGYAGYFQNTSRTTNAALGRGIRSLAAGALPTLFNSGDGAAGGEFAGPNGMIGVASDPAGAGVVGRAGQGRFGVFGASANADGFGGFFQNTSTTFDANKGAGLQALAAGASASAISDEYYAGGGEFVGPIGVISAASRTGGLGVMAIQGVGDLAFKAVGNARIAGNLDVTGTITKGINQFKIDHPLDPANKTLSHSVVESPDMKNVYDGNVVTDASGAAVVELPGYFEALNRHPRYQLTVIGSPGDAYISKKISGNTFSIQTEQPNVEVSWQVTGIRRDAYAVAHPIIVEEDKVLAERGRYLHPEEYGQPADLAIGAAQGRPQQQQSQLAAPVR